jgi:hypothetical protein
MEMRHAAGVFRRIARPYDNHSPINTEISVDLLEDIAQITDLLSGELAEAENMAPRRYHELMVLTGLATARGNSIFHDDPMFGLEIDMIDFQVNRTKTTRTGNQAFDLFPIVGIVAAIE